MITVASRLVDHTAEVTAKVQRGAHATVSKSLQAVASRASQLAPVESGALAGNFHTQQEGSTGKVFNTEPYFPYVEDGTSSHRAQPSLGPAAKLEDRYHQARVVAAVVEGTR